MMKTMSHALRTAVLCCFLLVQHVCAHAQTDVEIFDKVHGTVSGCLGRPMGELVLEVARSLEGTPYVASTLEVEPERLQVFLDRTDCILFVETCVALALTFKGLEIIQGGTPQPAEPSYGLFCRNVRNLRYRNGVVDGYPSRLHYTSDWIRQGEANGIFMELTGTLGERRPQKFNFMSTHPKSYAQLDGHPSNLDLVRKAELSLEGAGPYYWVPRSRLADPGVISGLKDGDIIAFVSSVDGLDITHVGIACTVDGKMHFVHASTSGMKVIVEPRTLAEYVKTGVRIIRMN